MAWLSSGKLEEVFRDAWPVYCQYSENDYAVAPVRLKSVRNLCRSKVLGLGLWGTYSVYMLLHSVTREKKESPSSYSTKSLSGSFM